MHRRRKKYSETFSDGYIFLGRGEIEIMKKHEKNALDATNNIAIPYAQI